MSGANEIDLPEGVTERLRSLRMQIQQLEDRWNEQTSTICAMEGVDPSNATFDLGEGVIRVSDEQDPES
jgi:hypothetical protein